MTPTKNETFSRVRTTLVECHEAERRVIRCWIYAQRGACQKTARQGTRATHLELEILHLLVEVHGQTLARALPQVANARLEQVTGGQVADLERLLSLELEPLALRLQFSLPQIDMGVEIGLNRV